MTAELFFQIVASIGMLLGLFMTIRSFISGKAREREGDIKDEEASRAETDVKIKDLEGRMNAQYAELNTKLDSMGRSIQETRITNSVFEARIIQATDKLDSKMERLQELVLKVFMNNKQTNN